MKALSHAILFTSAVLVAVPASAGERSAVLAVENVSCATCGPIVKRTLSRMPGVSRVTLVEQDGAAAVTVNFDDGKVTPDALAMAVTNAGYPAHLRIN